MRDKTHGEFIERWAEYVRTNSDWKKHHTEFINAQFQLAEAFIQRLLKSSKIFHMSETAFLSVSEHAQEQFVVLDESVTGGRKTKHSFVSEKHSEISDFRCTKKFAFFECFWD